MTNSSRALHLHTLDSLCADLVAGLSVEVGDTEVFQLKSETSRRILYWYGRNRQKWAANVQANDVEAIVDAVAIERPSQQNPHTVSAPIVRREFTLVSITAHQFAGLHHAGTSNARPGDFQFEFKDPVTLFEGYNGCGKTSLLNAIIWALTGEVLRPQRVPEAANKDFDFEVGATGTHSVPPVVPLPDPSLEALTAAAIPVDTWVEVAFEDEEKKLYRVRRSLKRGVRNTLKEEVTGIDELGLDPVSPRVGTTMPGILPYVQVGSSSALSKAVSELTGMAPLVSLANHAVKVKKKIDGDLTKTKNGEIQSVDEAYSRSRIDLIELIQKHNFAITADDIPTPSVAPTVETKLEQLSVTFDKLKEDGLNHAKQVLGQGFDAQDSEQRSNLVKSIAPALIAVSKLGALPSMTRLAGLTKLAEPEMERVRAFIIEVRTEASKLVEIASEPNKAARLRLYSRVASWISDHGDLVHAQNSCVVCGQSLKDIVDSITGLTIKEHLDDAAKEGDFAGKTFGDWAKHVLGEFATLLPSALALEVRNSPADSPTVLIRDALVRELFNDTAFLGSLKPLGERVGLACDLAFQTFPSFEFTASPALGGGVPEFKELTQYIYRVERALAHPGWRASANDAIAGLMRDVVGQAATEERKTEPESLMGQLLKLQTMVAAIEPVNEATVKQVRMLADIGRRRGFEARLKAYKEATTALDECVKVGDLAERQVSQLQKRLHTSATSWRDKIYRSAFPSTSMSLVASRMSGGGDLQLLVGASGVAAPAQHVSNASALRASLLAFYLAYWQYMLKERGGLRLMVLDDPQELLDGDNRDRLADAVIDVVNANAQLVLTTHDTRFAMGVAKRLQSKSVSLDHQYVHPATVRRGTIFLTPSIAKVLELNEKFKLDPDDPRIAQEYLSECRVFLEGRMGDLFDDRIYPAAATVNFAPTLSDHVGRLRGLVNSAPNELFKSRAITSFVNDPALKEGAATLVLLNKSHHRDKRTILPKDVFDIRGDLERLRQSVERAHEEFRNFNRREPLAPSEHELASLSAGTVPSFRIPISSSIKAFVRDASSGDTQEVDAEEITSDWFKAKAFFYVRSNTLGFSGPQGSVVIVDADAAPPSDRQLVIARTGKEIYARRLLKPQKAEFVALAVETPDPRKNPPTQLLHEKQVSLHPIVGVFFGGYSLAPAAKGEAVQVDDVPQLLTVKAAWRIKEDSAIPLALPGQIALGGAAIDLEKLDTHIDEYVALHLDDGTNLFKRVGARLPSPLQHLRQFETIGGLGVADVLAVGAKQQGFKSVVHAVTVIGVLYSER